MPDITPLTHSQISEAKRAIYTTAHEQFPMGETLEESILHYQTSWPLHDIDNFKASYLDKDGIFLVMSDHGEIIGTGALRRLDETACEIKRLWLLPAYQGQGLGYRMVTELLKIAREKGYTKVRLETSPAFQQRAYQFYLRLGFYEIPRYGDDPEDVGMEIIL
jgi:ribosomal protein S18 acetylase RimI-like enzyme